MILDVHVAYLIAGLSVLLGLTYTIGQFLDYKIEKLKQAKAAEDSTKTEIEVLVS